MKQHEIDNLRALSKRWEEIVREADQVVREAEDRRAELDEVMHRRPIWPEWLDSSNTPENGDERRSRDTEGRDKH